MTARRVLAAAAVAGLLTGLLGGCTASTGSAGGAADVGAASPSPAAAADQEPSAGQDPSALDPSALDPSALGPGAAPSPAASPSEDGDAPVLTLQGDGLGLLAPDDSVAPLPFGTPAAAVQQAVEDAMGPTTEVPMPSCPQGPRTAMQVDGFTVLLDGDSFVGWSDVGASDRSLTTADGIGAGSRLADLRSAVPDATPVPAAGGTASFTSAGGLAGELTGIDPAATVRVLWAGQICPGS